jgi:hypothetical protein
MPRRTYRPRSDAELDALAAITRDDVADAAATWLRDAPGPMRGLLDATPWRETPPETER